MKMSNVSNQRTLFQTWGSSVSQNNVVQPKQDGQKAAGRRRATKSNTVSKVTTHPPRNPLWTEIGEGSTYTELPGRADGPHPAYEDDDDDLMLVAVWEAEKSLQLDNANVFQDDNSVGAEGTFLSPTPSGQKTYPDFPGFDSSSAKVWIYPTNYPIREYQLKISEAALFQNTLVCLPTGLGKTFIAAVVMYNFYRWYPSGKIVFMAPTKPLVAQQIEACYKVMGIPQAHMAEMTGSTAANRRQEVWRSKRVFFLTPQVMVNDLSRDTCPAQQVKCVVIDEAHKALGNHAYCQVIRQLGSQNLQFRILALSATPGGDTKSVQLVISNLLISHIELRSEESPDIRAHTHQRNVEKIVVPLGEKLAAYQACYLQVLEKFMSRLVMNRVMGHKDLRTLSKYQLILARDQFRKNPPPHVKGPQQGMLEGDFALCISLYHGYELLMQMGLRSLFFYIQGIMDGSREMSRARNELQRTPTFMALYLEMEAMFVKPPAGPDEPFIYSHPKLEKLEEVVLNHFRRCAESSADNTGSVHPEVGTRVMIFSSFRESVQEIAAMLNRHSPLIRVMTFMGQASAGKGVKGFTQKEQLEVVQKFRQGGFNTLVSTCVGEEGLDIGEVDLIVCFDAQKNPIRLVQRMGRTGRKRQGCIVVILAEGREERIYNQSQSNKRSLLKSIVGNKSGFHMYPNSPRMLPEGVNPTLHKMHITCGQFDNRESIRRSVKGRRSHAEGRSSLIHPQNLNFQESVTSDSFLSSAEYSLWSSNMKLEEDEAHPTLKKSHFLSLPHHPPPQGDLAVRGPPTRELSLWEWRHWQHKSLPTHVIDHSLRCQHFIKTMELINNLREEDEGECPYEQSLLPYLNKADGGLVKGGGTDQIAHRKRQKVTKTGCKTAGSKPKTSHTSGLDYIDEEETSGNTHGTGLTFSFAKLKPVEHSSKAPCDNITDQPGLNVICPLESNDDYPCADMDEDCTIVNEYKENAVMETDDLNISPPIAKFDCSESSLGDVELQAMFYLPKWDSSPPSSVKLLPGRDESLKLILANVAELLSRSPPPLAVECHAAIADTKRPPSPPGVGVPNQPFQVSFTLDVDDDDDDYDDDDEVMLSNGGNASPKAGSDQPPGDKENNDVPRDWPYQKAQPVSRGQTTADSPTWDEVFGEDVNDYHDRRETGDTEGAGEAEQPREVKSKTDGKSEETERCWDDVRNEEMLDAGVKGDADPQFSSRMDESMDLFGNDEAFLQMTIPDISTPEDAATSKSSPGGEDITNSPKNTSHTHTPMNPRRTSHSALGLSTAHTHEKLYTHTAAPCKHATDSSITDESPPVHHKPESSDGSNDYFSVNFDLGYSLEDSEEEEEVDAARYMATSLHPKEQADSTGSRPGVSNSSTPFKSYRGETVSSRSGESKFSTPQGLSEQRKREKSSLLTSPLMRDWALPSPVASPGARRTLLPGPAGPRTLQHSPSLLTLKGRRPERRTTEADSKSAVEKGSCQELLSHSALHPAECNTDSEEEVVVPKRRHLNKNNPLMSPEMSRGSSVMDSPVVGSKKHVTALTTSDETEGETLSDDDFQNESTTARKPERQRVQRGNRKRTICRKGRQFLDEEAELSDDERAEASSDEDDGEDQNRSLDGFVVNNTHFSQGLNDSDMQGIYLKSVRSPAVAGKFKLSYRNNQNIDIFSQVPEMDETYAEDSFVVGSEAEEPESNEEDVEEEAIELMPEDSYVDGRRQYATRRQVFFHKARAKSGAGAKTRAASPQEQSAGLKAKRGRVIRIMDSSEEETEDVSEVRGLVTGGDVAVPLQPEAVQLQQPQRASCSSSSIASKVSLLCRGQMGSVSEDQQNERCRRRIENQHLLSDELDFEKSESLLSSKKQPQVPPAASSVPPKSIGGDLSVGDSSAPSAPVCILVDSRCISSGVELVTSLRQRHAATVHVCSLDGMYFIVSNRMAVERHSQSDLAALQNRKRLAERVTSLQGLFERVCLIVEKDRTKPGEASRPFQRTRCYDSTLAALVSTGVRLLWSDGAEGSAGLLAQLARLELRKGQGIAAPIEVKGQHRQLALQLYLSLPSVNYVHALNMSHNFSSIAHLINSPIEAIQKGGCMSQARAEEIYRFLRYSCCSFLINTSNAGKTC